MLKSVLTCPIVCHLFLVQNNKVLLLHRAHQLYENTWGVPGGPVVLGKSPRQAIISYTEDEIEIMPHNPKLIGVNVTKLTHDTSLHDPHKQHINELNMFFFTDSYSGVLHNSKRYKNDNIKFFDWHDLPAEIGISIKRGIKACLNHSVYEEFGF